MNNVWSIIMAGGVGSRFWPVSRAARPKQMLDLFGQGPMLRVTAERILPLAPLSRQLVVTGEVLAASVAEVLPELPAAHILAEPCGRNTAPAIAWSALSVFRQDPDAVLMVLPADQHIADLARYRAVAADAIDVAASGAIVTIGIPATRPETGYGYIRRGAALPGRAGAFEVDAFKEKPDQEVALSYLAAGNYLWNAGMFFMPARLILDELHRYEPQLMAAVEAMTDASRAEVWPSLKSISIDYAVMERTQHIAVIPGDFGWSDVGSWRSLWDHRPRGSRSFTLGDVIEIDGADNVLFADGDALVAAVGVNDLIVVHTADSTFVCPRDQAQRAREVVDALRAAGREELL